MPGRKSLRRIAESTGLGGAEQSLQQFVNQSPWDPRPVREALADQVLGAVHPAALIIDEVAFAKNGRLSPGVERQFVRSLGRVSNCQLALTVSATDGVHSIPLDWHLVLPSSWDGDQVRRVRAHIPDGERHQPSWQLLVQALDDVGEWPAVPPLPVVADATAPGQAGPLLAALEEHRHHYVLEVPRSLRVRRVEDPRAVVPRALPGGPAPVRSEPLKDLLRTCGGDPRHTVTWRKPGGGMCRSQFLTMLVSDGPRGPTGPVLPPRRLLVEWGSRRAEPSSYWLTDLTDHPLPDLVKLAMMQHSSSRAVEQMGRGFGLWDFEGRSFRGWHHHVTLASIAYGRHLLDEALTVRSLPRHREREERSCAAWLVSHPQLQEAQWTARTAP